MSDPFNLPPADPDADQSQGVDSPETAAGAGGGAALDPAEPGLTTVEILTVDAEGDGDADLVVVSIDEDGDGEADVLVAAADTDEDGTVEVVVWEAEADVASEGEEALPAEGDDAAV